MADLLSERVEDALVLTLAKEWIFTARLHTPEQAYELGLINRVTPVSELDAVVAEYVAAILASSPLTIRIGKAAFYDQLALAEAAAYERATRVMIDNAGCADAQEGMTAFLQKRAARWKGA